jgi:hypothetical protein
MDTSLRLSPRYSYISEEEEKKPTPTSPPLPCPCRLYILALFLPGLVLLYSSLPYPIIQLSHPLRDLFFADIYLVLLLYLGLDFGYGFFFGLSFLQVSPFRFSAFSTILGGLAGFLDIDAGGHSRIRTWAAVSWSRRYICSTT